MNPENENAGVHQNTGNSNCEPTAEASIAEKVSEAIRRAGTKLVIRHAEIDATGLLKDGKMNWMQIRCNICGSVFSWNLGFMPKPIFEHGGLRSYVPFLSKFVVDCQLPAKN